MVRSTLCALMLLVADCVATPPAAAQAIDTAAALTALRDFRAACEMEAGKLWGRSMCGPVALVEPRTRLVLANDTVAERPHLALDDAWIGVLPGGLPLANTAFRWVDRTWAMVLLPYVPDERYERTKLLVHESFHREQEALGLPAVDAASPHLDEEQGRLWLRMELRALAAALERSGRAADESVRDALLFRARRHALYPAADSLEALLELHEGLAEYTGVWTAMRLTGDSPSRLVTAMRDFEASPTYVRSFAYATAPAMGLLLDRQGPDWREVVRSDQSLHRLLGRSIRFQPPAALAREAERRAARYGIAAVRAAEGRRSSERQARLAEWRARLVEGPTLVLTQPGLQRSFNPSELVPLGDDGTVYPTGTFAARWGRLEVSGGGALLTGDYGRITVAAPSGGVHGPRVVGEGWALDLATGWTIRPVEGRAGSYEVVPIGGT